MVAKEKVEYQKSNLKRRWMILCLALAGGWPLSPSWFACSPPDGDVEARRIHLPVLVGRLSMERR